MPVVMNKATFDNANYPARPIASDAPYYAGLSKREHFAGVALQGLLAASGGEGLLWEDVARFSVQIADMMLVELSFGPVKE